MQDSAALANTDYVQLERLFQQLLKAKDAEAVTDNLPGQQQLQRRELLRCRAGRWSHKASVGTGNRRGSRSGKNGCRCEARRQA